MNDDWITVHGVFGIDSPTSCSELDAEIVVQQIVQDSVYGTFDKLPPYWDDKWATSPSELARRADVRPSRHDKSDFEFSIDLSAALFPPELGGLQHLVGVLAGDLFNLRLPQYKLREFTVTEVEFPGMRVSGADRAGTSRLETIRSQFRLKDNEPLLAFTFKPRTGITFDALTDVTLGVLKSGFHLVELDTRNLPFELGAYDRLAELAKNAAEMRHGRLCGLRHVTRFSPNLSVSAAEIVDLVRKFQDVQKEDPVVIKIDGGLDGLSSCQAVSKAFREGRGKPVITCYPLLRDCLGKRVPRDFFNEILVRSGADILYPGSRPDVGSATRQLGVADKATIIKAVKRYWDFVEDGRFMPTVAGGIHAGHLHAYYELLGPKVAYFLGGAVALHREGPIEGAKLCAKVVAEAVKCRHKSDDAPTVDNLDPALVCEIEAAYAARGSEKHAYVSPRQLIGETDLLESWFTRESRRSRS